MSIATLRQIITDAGGTPGSTEHGFTPIGLVRELTKAIGGTPTQFNYVYALRELITAAGGTPTQFNPTYLLRELVTALGGTPATYDDVALWGQVQGLGFNPFDPASLFASGEKGFIFDFTDASTLYKNQAGTTPVTSASDIIRYVADLSGNGNHATSDAGSPPTWSADGAVAAGSNYMQRTTALDLSGASAVTLVMAVKTAATGVQYGFIQGNPNTNMLSARVNSSIGNIWEGRVNLAGGVADANNNRAGNDGEFHIVTLVAEVGQPVIFRVDGEEYASSPTGSVSTPFLNAGFVLFTNHIGTEGLVGTCAFQALIDRKLSVSELYQIERHAGSLVGLSIISEFPSAGSAYYEMAALYGQSLSVGTQSTPSISTTTRFNDVCFTSGVRAAYQGQDYSAFTALVENDVADLSGGPAGETPVSGMAEMLHELGRSTPMVGNSSGFPARPIADLSTGTLQYGHVTTATLNGWRRAREQFQHFKVLAINWMQGEADSGNTTYAATLNTLRTDLDADIKAITKQPDDVWLLTYQLDHARIGLAHLAASDTYSNIRVAFPSYFIEHYVDAVHLTANGSKVAGAYFGLAYKAIITDGNTSWQPLRIQSHSRSGTTLDVTYNPVGALTLDTTIVPSQTNSGFRLFQSDGTTAITISSVALLDSDTVRITAASSIPAGAILRVGLSDPTDDNGGTIKTNLRDSQGDTIVFDGGGLDYPMHNWAVGEQLTVV